MLLNSGAEDTWLGLQGDQTSQSERKSVLNIHWKDWCWTWSTNTVATWCEELTHWKRPWCWESLKAWREGDNRGWDGWMASRTQWTWVWASSESWWWTGKPGMLQFMGYQRVRHDWSDLAPTQSQHEDPRPWPHPNIIISQRPHLQKLSCKLGSREDTIQSIAFHPNSPKIHMLLTCKTFIPFPTAQF